MEVVVDVVSAYPAWKVEASPFASQCVAEVCVLLVVAAFDGHVAFLPVLLRVALMLGLLLDG